jgi:hypothetical protein
MWGVTNNGKYPYVEAMITLSPAHEKKGKVQKKERKKNFLLRERKRCRMYCKMHSTGALKPGGKKLPAGQITK